MVIGGNDIVIGMLGGLMLLLYWWFDQCWLLLDDLEGIFDVVEELLWFILLVQGLVCIIMCDVMIGDIIILVGCWVLLLYGLVNCDEC